MKAVCVEKEQILLNAVEPQEHLSIAIRNKAQDVPAGRMRRFDVRHNANCCGAISAHAVNNKVRQVRRQHIRLQQLGIGSMRPLAGARPFFLHRFPKRQRSAGKEANVRRVPILPHTLQHTRNNCVAQDAAASTPFRGRFFKTEPGLNPVNGRPGAGNIIKSPSRVCIIGEVRKPPCVRLRSQAGIGFAPAMN